LPFSTDQALISGDVKSSVSGSIAGLGSIDEAISDSSTGWTVGAGFEYGITQNITFKTEYLYVDLGNQTLFSYSEPGIAVNVESETKFHTLKAGLNYKF
jgi:outer membrane immunogenic protein